MRFPSLQRHPHSCVPHDAGDGGVNDGGVEVLAEGIGSVHNRILLLVVEHVFRTDVDFPPPELLGDLSVKDAVGGGVLGQRAGGVTAHVGKPLRPVDLQREVELPLVVTGAVVEVHQCLVRTHQCLLAPLSVCLVAYVVETVGKENLATGYRP